MSTARQSHALAALLVCVTATTIAQAQAQAQSPMISARSLVESSDNAACALAVSSQVSVGTESARIGLISAPVGATGPVADARLAARIQPVLTASARTPQRWGWRVNAAGAVGASASRCASQSQWSRSWIQLVRAIPNGGVALAVGGQSLSGLDPSRDRNGVTASLWQAWGGTRVSVDVRSRAITSSGMTWFTRTILRPDSVRADSGSGGWIRFTRPVEVNDSAQSTQRDQALDLRTNWQQRIGRTSLDISVGGTRSLLFAGSGVMPRDSSSTASSAPQRVRMWARADARIAMTRSAELLLGLAALPAHPAYANRATRVVSVGFAFATGRDRTSEPPPETAAPAAFIVERMANDSSTVSTLTDSIVVRLRVRRPDASQVDVSGELFGWRPIAMRRSTDGWWEVPVRVRAGTYRMSVRVNGDRWTAPPGLPALRDEFGSESALVTIR